MIAIASAWLAARWATQIGRELICMAIGLAAIVAVFEVWIIRHDAKVREAVVREINADADKIARKAVRDRSSADQPGAADRLRRNYCRDC